MQVFPAFTSTNKRYYETKLPFCSRYARNGKLIVSGSFTAVIKLMKQ